MLNSTSPKHINIFRSESIDGGIKFLFFEDIFLKLQELGVGDNWLAFSGGGNITISENITIALFCNGLNISCEVLTSYDDVRYISNVRLFNLNHPNCKEKILEWAKSIYDSKS